LLLLLGMLTVRMIQSYMCVPAAAARVAKLARRSAASLQVPGRQQLQLQVVKAAKLRRWGLTAMQILHWAVMQKQMMSPRIFPTLVLTIWMSMMTMTHLAAAEAAATEPPRAKLAETHASARVMQQQQQQQQQQVLHQLAAEAVLVVVRRAHQIHRQGLLGQAAAVVLLDRVGRCLKTRVRSTGV
jgi:hypothetical protein